MHPPQPHAQPFALTRFADLPWTQANRNPSAPAFEHENQTWSRAAFAQAAHAMAHQLSGQIGVKRGERVAFLGLNHPLQVALLFALARLGAILVPLNWRLAEPELLAILADSGTSCLVVDGHWQAVGTRLAQQAGLAVLNLQALAAPTEPAAPANSETPNPDASELAQQLATLPLLLVYTSGTTGKPKGAVHTQANLLANMHMAVAACALRSDDVVATVLPLFHVGGLCIQTLPAMLVGAKVLLASKFDAGQTLAWVHEGRLTQLLQVPATLRALTEHADWHSTNWAAVRGVWAGSSVVSTSLIGMFHARGVRVGNVYGATETGPVSVVLPLAMAESHIGASGYPVVGAVVRLLALPGQAPGEGEVCIRAPNVVTHYWPDTPALDEEGFFHTGDVARRAPDGSYTIVGRCKDMVISGGENIYPAEVEAALLAHPAIADCAVLGVPDARWGEALVAVLVAKTASSAQKSDEIGTLSNIDGTLLLLKLEQSVSESLTVQLAAYKRPKRYFWVDTLPKTALGKVRKDALRQQIQSDLF